MTSYILIVVTREMKLMMAGVSGYVNVRLS